MRAKTLLASAFLTSVALLLSAQVQAQAVPDVALAQIAAGSPQLVLDLCPDGSLPHPTRGCRRLTMASTATFNRYCTNTWMGWGPYLWPFCPHDNYSFIDGAGCYCGLSGPCYCPPESRGARGRTCPWGAQAELAVSRRSPRERLVAAAIEDVPPRREPREPGPRSSWDNGRGRGNGFGAGNGGGHSGWSGGGSRPSGGSGRSSGGVGHGGGSGGSVDRGRGAGAGGGSSAQAGRPR